MLFIVTIPMKNINNAVYPDKQSRTRITFIACDTAFNSISQNFLRRQKC